MKKFLILVLALFLTGCDTMGLTGDGGTHKGDETDTDFEPNTGDDTEHVPTILINTKLTTVMEDGATAEDWTLYFTIEDVLDGNVTVTNDMLSWSPVYDYEVPGEYVLTCEYTNSEGTSNSASITITVEEDNTPGGDEVIEPGDDPIVDVELKDITPTTIYNMLMNNYAWDEVRLDNLEVVMVSDEAVVAGEAGSYLLLHTNHENVSPLAATLELGDIINVVGEIHMSNGSNAALGLYTTQMELVAHGSSTELFTMESDLSLTYDYIDALTVLRTDYAVYSENSNLINGSEIMNDPDMQDGVSYKITYLVTTSYEGYAPEIYIIDFEEGEEPVETPSEEPIYYKEQWNAFFDGSTARTVVKFVAELSEYQFVAQLQTSVDHYKYIMIVDTEGTSFEWISQSLIEGGEIRFDVMVEYTQDEEGSSFKVVPIAEPISILASEPAYFETSTQGEPYRITSQELIDELIAQADMGIFDDKYLERAYVMTDTFDADTNTFAGFNVSELGAQLVDSGEYTVSFIFTKLLKSEPYGEIAILPYFYKLPYYYELNNDIATFRSLTVVSNDGDQITAQNRDQSAMVIIDITNNPSWDDIQVEEVISVVGIANSDGYTDTEIEMDAIEITIMN